MLLITTAFKWEALPLISALGLVRDTSLKRLYNKPPWALLITGLGREQTERELTKFKTLRWESDFIVNFGVAGAPASFPVGSMYIIDQITDSETGDRYGPLALPKSPLPRASLITVGAPMDKSDPSPPLTSLVDMEASAIAKMAASHGALHRFLCIKIVLDHFNPVKPDKAHVEQLIRPNMKDVISVIKTFGSSPKSAG